MKFDTDDFQSVSQSAVDLNGMPCVISIVGPTASGKTSLGVRLAQALKKLGQSAEIINADAYQMYRGLDVGTAKPSAQERADVPHHLIDIVEPEETMSVAQFQQLARQTIQELYNRGVRPILVGGSGLYARAAVDDICFPGADPDVRQRLEKRAAEEGAGQLFLELQQRDPIAAERMDPRNERRTIRALEVIEITGRPFSASLPQYRYMIPAVQIGLDIERSELDKRIATRTELMRQEGLVDEVKRLRSRLGMTAARALGYEQVAEYLDNKISEDEAFEEIAQKTRRLARKQMGWFGRDPRIHWLNAMDNDLLEQALALVNKADKGEFEDDESTQTVPERHLLGSISA